VAGHGSRYSIITSPSFDESSELTKFAQAAHPSLKRIAVVADQDDAERFRGIGVASVIDVSDPPGLDLCAYVLSELGVDGGHVRAWNARQRASPGESGEVHPIE
jgi:hypothetical protein